MIATSMQKGSEETYLWIQDVPPLKEKSEDAHTLIPSRDSSLT